MLGAGDICGYAMGDAIAACLEGAYPSNFTLLPTPKEATVVTSAGIPAFKPRYNQASCYVVANVFGVVLKALAVTAKLSCRVLTLIFKEGKVLHLAKVVKILRLGSD